MKDRDLNIEVTDENLAALKGAVEWLSRTSDAELMGDNLEGDVNE